MNPSLVLPQFLTSTVKLFDVVYVNNILFLIGSALIILSNLNKIKISYLCLIFPLAIYFLFNNINYDGLRSLSHLIIFLIGPLISYLYITDEKKLNKFIKYINIGCLIIGIVSLVQAINWIESNGFNYLVDGEFFRISGLSTSPTDLVTQLTVGLFLSCAINNKKLRLTFTTFYVVLLLFTMSRSALVVLAIFFLSNLFNGNSKLPKKLVFLTLICIFIYLSPLGPLIEARIFDIGNSDINVNRFLVYSDIYEKCTKNIFNFIFGWGFGTYEFDHPIAKEIYKNPHNIFLYIFYSSGLVGFILFMSYIIYLLIMNINAYIICNNLEMKSLLRMILVLQFSIWTVGLVETNILGIGAGWILGLIFGAPLAVNEHLLKGPISDLRH